MPGHADYICNYTADPTGEYEHLDRQVSNM